MVQHGDQLAGDASCIEVVNAGEVFVTGLVFDDVAKVLVEKDGLCDDVLYPLLDNVG